MRDDLSSPNLGQTDREFKAEYFWQTYRTIEQIFSRMLAKGPVSVSTLTADEVVAEKASVTTLTATNHTMTGDLTIRQSDPRIILDSTSTPFGYAHTLFRHNGVSQWDFGADVDGIWIDRYVGGVTADAPFTISKATGKVAAPFGVIANLTGNVTGNVTGNTSGTHTGAVTGGAISGTTGTFSGAISGTTGTYTSTISTPGTVQGSYLNSTGGIAATTSISAGGQINSLHSYACRKGIGGIVSNSFNYFWNNAEMEIWVDSTNCGYMQRVSDYRTKKDIVGLGSTWSMVKALNPISYTGAAFTPPMSEEMAATQPEEMESLEVKPPLFAENDMVRWGFIAHELQETLLPSAATGYKDMPDAVQAPDQWAVLAALTKTIQEMQVRIETLEGLKL